MRINIKTVIAICKNCGNTFTKIFDSNRVQCSEKCRKEFRIKNKKIKIKRTKVCPKCNNLHETSGIFCSRSCANSRGARNEEFKKQARDFALANPRGWAVNGRRSNPNVATAAAKAKWAKLRLTLLCKECGSAFDVTQSGRFRKYCSVLCSNKNKYHINSNKKKTCFYKGFRMDSGAELIFAQQCDLLGIKWRKNTTQAFTFINSIGKSSKYYPDFFLEEYDIWVEIKGRRYIRPDDELRRAAVNNPVFLIISNQFKTDFEFFKEYIELEQVRRFERPT